jgi:hypothetical protein
MQHNDLREVSASSKSSEPEQALPAAIIFSEALEESELESAAATLPQNTPSSSEWDEAVQLALTDTSTSFQSREKSLRFSMIQQSTELPSTIVEIVEWYAAAQPSLSALMRDGDINPENFWQSVVGFFPIYECFPFASDIQSVPPLSLVTEKIKIGEGAASPYLETWGIAILLHRAKTIARGEGRMRYEEASDDDEPEEMEGYNSDGELVTYTSGYSHQGHLRRWHGRHPFFAADYGNSGYGTHRDKLASDPYLLSLQAELHKTSELAERLLIDEDLSRVVHHYPRLQSVFLSALLIKQSLPLSPVMEAHLAQWMPNSERPQHTLSAFQLLRVLNRTLRQREITLAALKTIVPIHHFLSTHQLAHLEDTSTFFNAVLSRAAEFLDPALLAGESPEATSTSTSASTQAETTPSTTSTSADLNTAFKAYCLHKESIPDSYLIFQYLLMGVTVDGKILGHLTETGHTQGVRLLLQVPEIDVNAYQSPSADTSLMIAVEKGHTDIADLLLRHADIHVNQSSSHDRHTALALAVHRGHLASARLLLEVPETNPLSEYKFPEDINWYDFSVASWNEGLIPQLAYQQKAYAIINLLFQALEARSVGDNTLKALLSHSKGDLRLIAASIAPNLNRFGSIALGLYVHKPEVVKLLSQVARLNGISLNGDDALNKIVRDVCDNADTYRPRIDFIAANRLGITLSQQQPSDIDLEFESKSKTAEAAEVILEVEVTWQGIHTALLTLLSQEAQRYRRREDRGNAEKNDEKQEKALEKKLRLLELLLSQPGIDVHYQGLVSKFDENTGREAGVSKKVSLLGLAARRLKYLQTVIRYTPTDPKGIQGDDALLGALACADPRETDEIVRYLCTATQLTPHALHTALFTLLRQRSQTPDTWHLLEFLFSQPGVDIHAEAPSEIPQQRRRTADQADREEKSTCPIETESLFSIATQHARHLQCLAQAKGLNTHTIPGDRALLKAIFTDFYADFPSFYTDSLLEGERGEPRRLHTVTWLLAHTHITVAGIHTALLTLLRKKPLPSQGGKPPDAETVRILALLFSQPGVDIYQADTSDDAREILLDLASQEASYLLCLAEHPHIDLRTVSGDTALLNLVSSREGDWAWKLATVQQLLDRTCITVEGIHQALFSFLRAIQYLHTYQEASPDTHLLNTLALLFSQPGVYVHQESVLRFHEEEFLDMNLSIASYADLLATPDLLFSLPRMNLHPKSVLREQKDTLLSLASTEASYLWCLAHCPGVDLSTVNGDAALIKAITARNGRWSEKLETVEQLLARTHITVDALHKALFHLLPSSHSSHSHRSANDAGLLQLLTLLFSQSGIDIHARQEGALYARDTLLSLASKEASYLLCLAQCPSVAPHSINGDEVLRQTVSPYTSNFSSTHEAASLTRLDTVQRLLAFTRITPEGIYAALSTLLERRSDETHTETLQIIALLVSQPGVDVQKKFLSPWHHSQSSHRSPASAPTREKESLLEFVTHNPDYLPCLAASPEIDVQVIFARLNALIEARENLVKTRVMSELKKITRAERAIATLFAAPYGYSPAVSGEYATADTETDKTNEPVNPQAEQLITYFERALLEQSPIHERDSRRVTASLESKQDDGHLWMGEAQRSDFLYGISKHILTPLFKTLQEQQAALLTKISLLLASPYLRAAHIEPLLKRAQAAGLEDVVKKLASAPGMQQVLTAIPEQKTGVADDRKSGQTDFFEGIPPQAPRTRSGSFFDPLPASATPFFAERIVPGSNLDTDPALDVASNADPELEADARALSENNVTTSFSNDGW